MSLGIPKVRFTFAGDEHMSWIEIEEFIFYDRMLILFGVIDPIATSKLIKLLFFLEYEDEYDSIYLYIKSPGGGAYEGIAIYDTMNAINPDVCTLVMGLAASAASLVLTGGAAGKRVAFRHARVMIHQPMIRSRFYERPGLLPFEEELMLDLRNTIADIYAKNTKKPLTVIQRDLDRDTFMSAKEAQAYGIIDHIPLPPPKKEGVEKAVTKEEDD